MKRSPAPAHAFAVAPQLLSANVAQLCDFLIQQVGFQLLPADGLNEYPKLLLRDEIELHLWPAPTMEQATPMPSNTPAWSAMIWVEDLNALRDELRERGTAFTDAPVEGFDALLLPLPTVSPLRFVQAR